MSTKNTITQSNPTTNNYTVVKKSKPILASVLIIIVFMIYAYIFSQGITLYKYRTWEKTLQNRLPLLSTPIPQNPVSTTDLIPTQLYKYPFGIELTDLFDKAKTDFSGQLIGINDDFIWWISEDDLNIINSYESGIEYRNFSCSNKSLEDSKPDIKSISISLAAGIKQIMEKYGFSLNLKNSSVSLDDKQHYDYVQAYEKDTTKCIFRANPDCHTQVNKTPLYNDFTFSCTELFNQNYAIQAKYLKDLNLNNVIIQVSKQTGNFVKLDIHYRRTGHYMIAKKINGKWNEVFSGQGAPSCSIMEEFQVPQEIYGNCIE